jgi:hypothetical protein
MTTTTDTLESTTTGTTASDATVYASTPVVANTFSITALVLGILGIALGQPLLAIAAIIVGVVARPREPQATSTSMWGIVLGIVGLLGGFALATLGLIAFTPLLIGGVLGAGI